MTDIKQIVVSEGNGSDFVQLDLTNLGNCSYVLKPVITSPSSSAVEQSTFPNIVATAYKNVFADDERETRIFQISTSLDFSAPVREKEINADTWTVEEQLEADTQYFVRVMDRSVGGLSSPWSDVISFTTGDSQQVNAPTITIKGYNDSTSDFGSGLKIELSEFSTTPGIEDTHQATSYYIDQVTGRAGGHVWESLNNTSEKTGITVPDGTLTKSTRYRLSVIYIGTKLGASAPATVEFTTSSDFGTVNVPTLTIEGGPNDVYETPTLTGGAFSNTRDPDTHEMSDWKIVPSAGGDAVWESMNDSSHKTFIVVPAKKLQVSTAYKAMLRYKGTKFGWSEWQKTAFTTVDVFVKVQTPTVSGKTSDVLSIDRFTGSKFTMEAGSGSHDKSDWILEKKAQAGVEVWSSKNDGTNKTQSPDEMKDHLEVSTEYILKLRYHDANNDIWSEYGQIEFSTAEQFTGPTCPVVFTQGIHFKASKSGSNVNFFNENAPIGCRYEVWINNSKKQQAYNSVSFEAEDDILIKCVAGDKFPWFYCNSKNYSKNYIKELIEPLPILYTTNGTAVTDFSRCFFDCSSLTSIPENLFANNTAVTKFSSCFYFCSSLTSIPENLFANNTAVTDFSRCFFDCSSLTSIPENLFANNTAVTKFSSCFRSCSSLTSIPENLFANNTAVTDFSSCFHNCSSLTSIPENLFANNTAVTDFNSCFYYCSSLTSIPENLFANNTAVTDFSTCFCGCSSLTVFVRIGSKNVNSTNSFAEDSKSKGTVFVPRGSTTASTFRSDYETNVNVIEE